MFVLRQNSHVIVPVGPFLHISGMTAATDLVITKDDIKVIKADHSGGLASADQGTGDSGANHDGGGVYHVEFDLHDTDTLGTFKAIIAPAACIPQTVEAMIMRQTSWDGLYADGNIEVTSVKFDGLAAAFVSLMTGKLDPMPSDPVGISDIAGMAVQAAEADTVPAPDAPFLQVLGYWLAKNANPREQTANLFKLKTRNGDGVVSSHTIQLLDGVLTIGADEAGG